MKKGDIVTVDLVNLEKKHKENAKQIHPQFNANGSISFKKIIYDFKKFGNFQGIADRVNNGMTATITSINGKMRPRYCNLEFEDGFKVGVGEPYLIKIN